MADTPIPTDPILAMLLAGARMAGTAAGPYLVASGYVTADSLPGLLTLAASAVTMIYGMYRTHQRQVALRTKG